MTGLEELTAQMSGRYRIERELGRGGMGAVYLARDVRLDRPVALKVLPPEFVRQVALRERFLRETRTAASFSHPNIVPVYSVEESDDTLAYAMAYVEGESLADRVNRAGPLSVRETVRLLQDAGYALAYAHGRGVVHRDIKPDNIMIERATGRALVMDFGIARVISGPLPAGSEGLTRIGEVVGTPEYMSPEQATGDHVDGRSDLYSLGLTAFFAVTGTPAVSGDTTGRVLARQITEALPSVSAARPDIPAPLADAIQRCAAKDPADRFPNAEALVEAIDEAQLSAPEIPLAIRLFANEVTTLSMVLISGALLIGWLVQALMAQTYDELLLPIVLVAAVLLTRVMQTLREARRLALAGFSDDEINGGMTAVFDEHEVRRAELRADPVTRRARKKTLITAGLMIMSSVVAFPMARMFRHQVPNGDYYIDLPGTILVFTAMILSGIGVALLLRSPFRMPLGERVFRLVWLGPIGRAFVRFGGRKVVRASVTRASPPRAVVTRPAPVVIPPSGGGQLASLESRVAELERWRRESRA